MNRLSTGIEQFVRCGAARVPADTLEIELCTSALPAAPPLDLYLNADGGRAGHVKIISIRRLALAQQAPTLVPRPPGGLLFAEADDDTVFCLLPDGIYAIRPGQVDRPERIAPDLDVFLQRALAGETTWAVDDTPSTAVAHTPCIPHNHAARIAEKLTGAMPFLPSAGPVVRYAVRRATSLHGEARFSVLKHMCEQLFDDLPGAYTQDILTDRTMDAVIEELVEPLLRRFRSDELERTLLVSSLSDLGEHFCEQTENNIAAFVGHFLRLLEMADADAPPDVVELHVSLRRLDEAIANITGDAYRLLATLPRAPMRDHAMRNAGFGWLVDHPG